MHERAARHFRGDGGIGRSQGRRGLRRRRLRTAAHHGLRPAAKGRGRNHDDDHHEEARFGKGEVHRIPLTSTSMHITHLWRYPVKSFAGEALTSVEVQKNGFAFDRCYALIDRTTHRDGKTLTARQRAATLSYAARMRDERELVVTAPAGTNLSWDDPRLERELSTTLDQPFSLGRSDTERFYD